MPGGNHGQDIREYEITSKRMVIAGERLDNDQRLITGIPGRLKGINEKEELSLKSKTERKPERIWILHMHFILLNGVSNRDASSKHSHCGVRLGIYSFHSDKCPQDSSE
jgi:hypothetical protein